MWPSALLIKNKGGQTDKKLLLEKNAIKTVNKQTLYVFIEYIDGCVSIAARVSLENSNDVLGTSIRTRFGCPDSKKTNGSTGRHRIRVFIPTVNDRMVLTHARTIFCGRFYIQCLVLHSNSTDEAVDATTPCVRCSPMHTQCKYYWRKCSTFPAENSVSAEYLSKFSMSFQRQRVDITDEKNSENNSFWVQKSCVWHGNAGVSIDGDSYRKPRLITLA